jgi:hypothetical protein
MAILVVLNEAKLTKFSEKSQKADQIVNPKRLSKFNLITSKEYTSIK